jgi:hypothetical protein
VSLVPAAYAQGVKPSQHHDCHVQERSALEKACAFAHTSRLRTCLHAWHAYRMQQQALALQMLRWQQLQSSRQLQSAYQTWHSLTAHLRCGRPQRLTDLATGPYESGPTRITLHTSGTHRPAGLSRVWRRLYASARARQWPCMRSMRGAYGTCSAHACTWQRARTWRSSCGACYDHLRGAPSGRGCCARGAASCGGGDAYARCAAGCVPCGIRACALRMQRRWAARASTRGSAARLRRACAL